MFLLVPLWIAGLFGNLLVLYPGITSGGRQAKTRWNNSIKFYRISYVIWNLISLLAFVGVLIGLRVEISEVEATRSMWIALWTSLQLSALVSTLAALFFSAQLKDRFDGYCAAAIIWLIFGLIFTLVGTYEILLARFSYLAIELVSRIFLICASVAHCTYVLGAWLHLHRMQIRQTQKQYDSVGQLFSDVLRRKLFSYGVYIVTCAWVPFIIHALTLIYDHHFEFDWHQQVNAGCSLALFSTLVLPAVVFLYPANRGALRHTFWTDRRVQPICAAANEIIQKVSTVKNAQNSLPIKVSFDPPTYHLYESIQYSSPNCNSNSSKCSNQMLILDNATEGETEA